MDTRIPPGDDTVGLFSGLLKCGCCSGNMTRKMVRHGNIVYHYYYCPTGKRRGCTAPVMISDDVFNEIVFNEISRHIEKSKAMSKEIEQMTDEEILHLFTKEKLADLEVKQTELQKLQEYKSSLRISKIRGVISADECKDMMMPYGEDIKQLEVKIAKTIKQVQKLTAHVDEQA